MMGIKSIYVERLEFDIYNNQYRFQTFSYKQIPILIIEENIS